MHLGKSDEELLRDLIDRHLRYTASSVALRILDNWDSYRGKFVQVFPNEYKRALGEMAQEARHRRKTTGTRLTVDHRRGPSPGGPADPRQSKSDRGYGQITGSSSFSG